MIRRKMILEMQGYWIVGSGKGGGMEVDTRIDRDSEGFPYVPGKMIKGLLKDACKRLYSAGISEYGFTDEVFGSSVESKGLDRTETKPGRIFISDARLTPAIRNALLSDDNRKALENLTRNIYSTAIDEETGTAKKGSLRGYEVSVPMRLQATVEGDLSAEEMKWIELAASRLVYAVGSHKSRGLGETRIFFEDED